jgi:hypothetical protein
VELEVPSELPHWSAGESAPGAAGTSELEVDVLGGFFLSHVLQARDFWNLFVAGVGRGG